jgi:hypothetical protein
MHAVLAPALVRTVLLLALTALLAEAADGGGAAHTAAFVCNVPVNDSVAVDVHWVSGGRRKLKHTFTAPGERWKTRTAPGHQFVAFLRTTTAAAAVDQDQDPAAVPAEQLLARYTVGTTTGEVYYIDQPAATPSPSPSQPPPASPGAAAVALTPAEAAAVAAAATEAETARAAPPRPGEVRPTADLPIPPIDPTAESSSSSSSGSGKGGEGGEGGDGSSVVEQQLRYVPGAETRLDCAIL